MDRERTARLNIPVTADELSAYKQTAMDAGYPSMAEWVRQTLAGRHVSVTVEEHERLKQASADAGYSTVDEYGRRVLAGLQTVAKRTRSKRETRVSEQPDPE